MKILLIGFSKPNANAITMFVVRNYPNYHCVSIERNFDGLNLCLPNLSHEESKAEVMLINLKDVGMVNFSQDNAQTLLSFIGNRASLLIGRNDLEKWQALDILSGKYVGTLQSPYNLESMSTALKVLLESITSDETTHNNVATIDNHLHSNSDDEMVAKIEHEQNLGTVSTVSEKTNKFIHKLLDVHFNIPQNKLLHKFVEITETEGVFKITIGSSILFVHHEKNLALVIDLDNVLRYCALLSDRLTLVDKITMTPITEEEFDKIFEGSPQNGYKKYALSSTLLWQVYSAALPDLINTPRHNLLLKMRYMPNFASKKNIPMYIHTAVSSCLISPKSLSQLSVHLEDENNYALLNRVFLLAILSGAADVDILRQSFEQSDAAISVEKRQENEGVQKAQKTGFFKRLLSKLSW